MSRKKKDNNFLYLAGLAAALILFLAFYLTSVNSLKQTLKTEIVSSKNCLEMSGKIADPKTEFDLSDISEMEKYFLKLSSPSLPEEELDINADCKFSYADVISAIQCKNNESLPGQTCSAGECGTVCYPSNQVKYEADPEVEDQSDKDADRSIASLVEKIKKERGLEPTDIIIPGSHIYHIVNFDLEIPQSISLKIGDEGSLELNAGRKVVINSKFLHGKEKIFQGSGKVEFGINTDLEIYPQWWGALGDGLNDDTNSLQLALMAAAGKGRIVLDKPSVKYRTGPVSVPSKTNMYVQNGVVIEYPEQAWKANSSSWWNFNQVQNVEIIADGAIWQFETKPDDGEHRHIFCLRASKDVYFKGMTVKSSGGDGFYINDQVYDSTTKTWKIGERAENISIENIIADNNRRQGISIISGKNIIIKNSILQNTNGTPPSAGLDLEPNDPNQILENIKVIDVSTNDNAGSGMSIYLKPLNAQSQPVSIEISGHTDKNSAQAFGLFRDDAKGEITYNGKSY